MLNVLVRDGEGPTVLLVHGSSAHARWWDFVAPELAPAARVLAVDLRGHGESEWSGEKRYGLDDYVTDVARVVEAMAPGPVTLVGHSLGALVAARYALEHPDRTGGLVVVDGRVRFSARAVRYMQALRNFLPGTWPSREEAIASFQVFPRGTVASPEVLRHVAETSVRENGDGTWRLRFDPETFGGFRERDLTGELGRLRCPVLFVRGELSRVLDRETAADLAARCRHGSWTEVEGAHHHVLIDRAAELANVLREFLSNSRT